MNEIWSDVHNDISAAEKPEKVLALLQRVDEYDGDTRWRVLSSGLDRLWDLEYSGFVNVLLDECAKRSGYEGHIIHRLLERWLKENPHERDGIIHHLLSVLDEPDASRVHNVLWTLIFIGYRDEALQRKLLAFVTAPPNEEAKYIALWGLTWLGYPYHEFIEETIKKIIEEGESVPQLIRRCGRDLASVELLPYFQKYLLRTRFSPEETGFVDLLYVLSDTARAHPEVASTVWDTILEYENVWEDGDYALNSVFRMMSDITHGIDDIRVVDFFLHRLEPDDPDNLREWGSVSSHYHSYLRLINLDQPQQLAAISTSLSRADVDTRDKVVKCLHQDTTVDTRNESSWQTQLTHLKEHSWDITLRIGMPEANLWLIEAFNETSYFALADVCRLAGYLRVTEAIPILHDLIKRTGWDEPDGIHIWPGIAALRALGNIGTKEAFQALTDSQVSLKTRSGDVSISGTTPRDQGEAFAACVLTMENVAPLIDCLEQNSDTKPRCWISCAFALQQVTFAVPSLVAPYRERILALVRRNNLIQEDHLNKHYLLPALGSFDKDKETERLLLYWACETGPVAMEAMELLARWGTLHSHHSLLNKLGLEYVEQAGWKVIRRTTDREAFIVGLLFSKHPEEFTSAVCSLIENGTYREAVQVFQQLNSENASSAILDALTSRTHSVNKPFQAETEALLALRRIAPNRFVKEFPYEVVFNWHAAAREAIVTAYRELDTEEAPDTLAKFLTDSAYTIRRIAARTLAKANSNRLYIEAENLLKSQNVHDKVCGIEAATWLTEEAPFQTLFKQARQDREANVRSSASEAVRERRRGILARKYLPIVLDTPADQLTTTWQYGQALHQVGDDETLSQLREAAVDLKRCPNQRAYLKYLTDQVQKAWEEWQRKRKDRLEE